MKKLIPVFALVALATPAFAHDDHYHANHQHVYHDNQAAVANSTYTEQTTYRAVERPLTQSEVELRRNMITKIEQDFKKVDLDGNRQISYAEYSNGEQRFHKDNYDVKTSFMKADTNNDGNLSSQEILDWQLVTMGEKLPVKGQVPAVVTHQEQVIRTSSSY